MPASVGVVTRNRGRSVATQLTVRGVDRALTQALDAEARRRGLSVNRCVLALLRAALGLIPDDKSRSRRFADLDSLAGTWTVAEAEEFAGSLREQRKVDKKIWR